MLLQGIVKNTVCYNIFLIQMMMTLPAALMGAPLSLELMSTRELDIPSHHFSLTKTKKYCSPNYSSENSCSENSCSSESSEATA